MYTKKLNQDGFHLSFVVIALLVIGIIGFAGWRVMQNQEKSDSSQSSSQGSEATGDPVWKFNEQKQEYFVAQGKAPDCKEPFTFENSPVDLSKLSSVGMPGSYRGFSYKPHGLMRADNMAEGKLDVKMPMDATLVGLTRYYEGNPSELQYLLTFESDCGIAFRFDHLYTLSPAFQAIAETTPEPKKDDTRTDPNIQFKRTKFKAGDVVATQVGFQKTNNFGFDFGVYDYRKRNEISNNEQWAAIHNMFTSQEWFGVCWLGMLPGDDAPKAKDLANVIINPSKPTANQISDYCPGAKYKTLDFNGGKPTDG